MKFRIVPVIIWFIVPTLIARHNHLGLLDETLMNVSKDILYYLQPHRLLGITTARYKKKKGQNIMIAPPSRTTEALLGK